MHKYIIGLRLSDAAKLLTESNAPITDVCEKIGIKDSKYFSGLYKKYYKMSPGKFRKIG